MSSIPLLNENSLRHNNDGETYNNGSFAEMERYLVKLLKQ